MRISAQMRVRKIQRWHRIYELYILSDYWSQAYGTLKPPQSVLALQCLFILRINVMEEYVRAYVVYLLSGVLRHVA